MMTILPINMLAGVEIVNDLRVNMQVLTLLLFWQ